MFSSDTVVIRLVDVQIARDFADVWNALGLTTAVFTSDDKKQAIIFGTGESDVVAQAAAVLPPEPKPVAIKGGK